MIYLNHGATFILDDLVAIIALKRVCRKSGEKRGILIISPQGECDAYCYYYLES